MSISEPILVLSQYVEERYAADLLSAKPPAPAVMQLASRTAMAIDRPP